MLLKMSALWRLSFCLSGRLLAEAHKDHGRLGQGGGALESQPPAGGAVDEAIAAGRRHRAGEKLLGNVLIYAGSFFRTQGGVQHAKDDQRAACQVAQGHVLVEQQDPSTMEVRGCTG